MNREVTNHIFTQLKRRNYKVHKLLITPDIKTKNIEQILSTTAAELQCNRILKISHEINEDANGRFFRYDIQLMKIAPQGYDDTQSKNVIAKMTKEYSKSYRYSRTQDVLNAFNTETFGHLVVDDLRRDPVLKAIQ